MKEMSKTYAIVEVIEGEQIQLVSQWNAFTCSFEYDLSLWVFRVFSEWTVVLTEAETALTPNLRSLIIERRQGGWVKDLVCETFWFFIELFCPIKTENIDEDSVLNFSDVFEPHSAD